MIFWECYTIYHFQGHLRAVDLRQHIIRVISQRNASFSPHGKSLIDVFANSVLLGNLLDPPRPPTIIISSTVPAATFPVNVKLLLIGPLLRHRFFEAILLACVLKQPWRLQWREHRQWITLLSPVRLFCGPQCGKIKSLYGKTTQVSSTIFVNWRNNRDSIRRDRRKRCTFWSKKLNAS